MRRYVGLLRGINVGGRNKLGMAELRAAVEQAGYADVATYIQSGNVVFATGAARGTLEDDLEAMLERRFALPIRVVVRSARQMGTVVDAAPAGFGSAPDVHHSDVVFLKRPLTPARAMRAVELREGVDAAWPGTGVIYFQRLSARRGQSRLSRLASTPEYQLMTIRNWRTTKRLRAMADG